MAVVVRDSTWRPEDDPKILQAYRKRLIGHVPPPGDYRPKGQRVWCCWRRIVHNGRTATNPCRDERGVIQYKDKYGKKRDCRYESYHYTLWVTVLNFFLKLGLVHYSCS